MRILPVIILCVFAFCSCGDNGCMNVKPEAEEQAIIAYANANSISATKHSSGLFYQVISQGSGPTPTTESTIWVTYTGRHLNGTVFDQSTTPISYKLKEFIDGWKIGLPLIQKGGYIRLIIPSSLAYGCATTYSSMPPNSILHFDIQLIDVQ